ncbi:MAG: response regulator [Desulfarculaceae bacterium]|nr:response regulator [Desulfarculaceae bacterium]MCF8071705.1 response regulator [Desulfarculaceae bacterium]MCF8102448.1 response regulator [Desulfarculaceae bacterium]MCF8116790.1 response regulator [Desulfarculaceae bacterium]
MAGKRVLIIDDDPDLVEAVSMLLEAEGMEPLAAYGGIEGLEKARKESPDLIILDVMMEDKDGFAVAKEVANDQSLGDIPVIMLTAVAEHAMDTSYAPQAAIKSLEADEWFDKPVDPAALVERIKEFIG